MDRYISDDLVDCYVKPLVCSFSEFLSIDTFFKCLVLLLPHLVVFSHNDSKLHEDLRVDQDLLKYLSHDVVLQVRIYPVIEELHDLFLQRFGVDCFPDVVSDVFFKWLWVV